MIADEAQHTRGDGVRVLQRKLYRAAKEAPQRLSAAEAQAPGQGLPRVPSDLLQEGRAVSAARHDCAGLPHATW